MHCSSMIGLAAGLILAAASATGPPYSRGSSQAIEGWVRVAAPAPGSESWYCDNYSSSYWEVSGSPIVSIRAVTRHGSGTKEPLPFEIPAAPRNQDLAGDRRVKQVPDGWLVGFDHGEWGGGLWWFSQDGSRRVRVRPPAGGPPDSVSGFVAENVVAFDDFAGTTIVFMGLDHAGGQSGRLFRVVRGPEGWQLILLANLRSRPRAWVHDGDSILIQTGDVLWRLLASGQIVQLHQASLPSSPSSLALGESGRIYVGLRRFIVRLVPVKDGFDEEWFVREECRHFELRPGHCECRP